MSGVNCVHLFARRTMVGMRLSALRLLLLLLFAGWVARSETHPSSIGGLGGFAANPPYVPQSSGAVAPRERLLLSAPAK